MIAWLSFAPIVSGSKLGDPQWRDFSGALAETVHHPMRVLASEIDLVTATAPERRRQRVNIPGPGPTIPDPTGGGPGSGSGDDDDVTVTVTGVGPGPTRSNPVGTCGLWFAPSACNQQNGCVWDGNACVQDPACIPVNYVNDNPGHLTCDCVLPEDPCLEDDICREDYYCTIGIDKTQCEKERDSWTISSGFKPNCDGDGTYLPIQCTQTGDMYQDTCWCVESDGQDIPGTTRTLYDDLLTWQICDDARAG